MVGERKQGNPGTNERRGRMRPADRGRRRPIGRDRPRSADRRQTLHDYTIGISLFIITLSTVIVGLFGFVGPLSVGVGSEEISQSDRVATTLVQNLSTGHQPNEPNAARLEDTLTQSESDGTTITYENGAVFRTYSQDNIAIVQGPPMTCTEDRAVVSVVSESTDKTSGDYVSVMGTTRTRELRFPMNRTGEDSIAEADELFVTVDSPRSDTWDRHFERSGNWTAGPAPDSFRYDGIDAMYVRETIVSVSFAT